VVAADPDTARYARVLEVTYLRAATTQEAAAARLNLPFSTYRRHLRAGAAALADVLWEWEIHGEMTPSDPIAHPLLDKATLLESPITATPLTTSSQDRHRDIRP
jgi:hypothetical protein